MRVGEVSSADLSCMLEATQPLNQLDLAQWTATFLSIETIASIFCTCHRCCARELKKPCCSSTLHLFSEIPPDVGYQPISVELVVSHQVQGPPN